ncbi:MAG: DUF5615 family PIN-like protein [Armatimonadota bacterium]|jgi:predicted nuclease of predicted toxin-antitoxin system|nr:DUF5615 family PIN-like protein [Armatimonadota bacterium]MDT7973601.1 DUF5615 family PIN-like protein [Armatimonadota bacterium]
MKIKLDENIDLRAKDILILEGHEVVTVAEEGLMGAPDEDIARIVKQEKMCLLTLDLGFANVLRYPPKDYAGIVVLRHPRLTTQGLLDLVRQFAGLLKNNDPSGRLWIVEPGRLRIWEPKGETNGHE